MGLSRGREMGSLLMHASTPITPVFLGFLCLPFFFFLFFFFALPLFLVMVPSPFHCSQLWPFILPAMLGFTTFTPQPLLVWFGCPSKTAHWPVGYLATTITPCRLHHVSFPNKSGLFYLLPLFVFTTLIWIRVKPLLHLPLWHASSGSSFYLLLLGEMSSQQDIFPKEVWVGTLK